MKKIIRAVRNTILSLIIITAAITSLFADVIYLNDGQVLRGKVVYQNDEMVTIESNAGEETILIGHIRKIAYSRDRYEAREGASHITINSDEAMESETTHVVSAAATNRVQAEPVTNLAVADLAGKNVSQADASIVADFLRTELVNTGRCNVVEKANMDKILAESSFEQTGFTASERAVRIGKILNVGHMIVGSLSKLTDTYYITVNLVEVETGEIVASYDQKVKSADGLKTACKLLARKLVYPQEK